MTKLFLSREIDEQSVSENIELLLKLSVVKASKLLEELGVFEILNRPRSPEEIFHMLNFNTLDEEFVLLFDLLSHFDILQKQGEFYSDNPRRPFLLEDLKVAVNEHTKGLLMPFDALFNKLIFKYESILKGEQGKLAEKELISTLDGLVGTEFFFIYREIFFKKIKERLSSFDVKETLTFLNWGVGSGFDAIHLADYFKERVMVLSIEPENSIHQCRVVQDLYEVYNVEFFEIKQLDSRNIHECVDLFVGTPFFFKKDFKDYVKIIQSSLPETGFFALSLVPDLTLALDWILCLYEQYEFNLIKKEHIAKLKHYGLSRIKYIGMNNGFMLIQKE
ncbi:MAG: hypothetical protein ACTSSG_05560 [Candidatus Heimdallarchaeaceae archaeon]